jgi:mRNA-degrading endonuclease RelE of RelBE toxin-antitoxin system
VQLIVSSAALKDMASMPSSDREALLAKATAFAAEPFAPRRWVAPLKGRSDTVRLRQGVWRAICRIDRAGQTVIVDAVAHRREVYR